MRAGPTVVVTDNSFLPLTGREDERDTTQRERELKEAARLVDEELRDSTELIRNARNPPHRHPVGAAGVIR